MTPATHDFGDVPTGDSGSAEFTVTNLGDETSGVTAVSIAGVDMSQFVVADSSCTGALAGGASCAVTVRFEPTTFGAKSAALVVEASPGGGVAAFLDGTGAP